MCGLVPRIGAAPVTTAALAPLRRRPPLKSHGLLHNFTQTSGPRRYWMQVATRFFAPIYYRCTTLLPWRDLTHSLPHSHGFHLADAFLGIEDVLSTWHHPELRSSRCYCIAYAPAMSGNEPVKRYDRWYDHG
jgi:hypothetical protein